MKGKKLRYYARKVKSKGDEMLKAKLIRKRYVGCIQ